MSIPGIIFLLLGIVLLGMGIYGGTVVIPEAADAAMRALEYAFEFMEAAFGDSQEMVSFVTELNTNYYSIQFLKDNDCAKYYQYNKKLLFEEQHQEIMTELDEIEQDLNTAVK